MAIGLGFDAVNGEHNRRTLSRILAQPNVDALLFGKFLAGLATLAIALLTLWLLTIGFGLLRLGLPPGGEEMMRAFVPRGDDPQRVCGGLARARCRRRLPLAATAALVTLGLWLFLSVIWPALSRRSPRSSLA